MFGDYEFWVQLVGYASIVSVAIFGLIGALSKEWDRRREQAAAAEAAAEPAAEAATPANPKPAPPAFPWSYIAAIGIILSAVFAMTTNILRDRIDDRKSLAAAIKAKADRDELDGNFRKQLNGLRTLRGQMVEANRTGEKLRSGMAQTLQSQALLLANASRSILMTSLLTRQERANSHRLLEDLWRESNRITGGTINAVVAYTCPVELQDLLPFMSEDAYAKVTIRRPGSEEWAADELISLDQRVTLPRAGIEDMPYNQVTRFSPFLVDSTFAEFQDPRRWEGATVQVNVTGVDVRLLARMHAFTPLPSLRWREFTTRDMPVDGPSDVRVVPCHARMGLFVNERGIAGGMEGEIVIVRARSDDRQGRVFVRFRPEEVDMDDFPQFNGL